MTDTLKNCKTCHWRRDGSNAGWKFWRCESPDNVAATVNPVNGELGRQYTYCEEMRKYGICGPDGKLWQQRIEPPLGIGAFPGETYDPAELLDQLGQDDHGDKE
jgi:hypothetical protein